MGRKCNVKGCQSDSNRPKDVGVTFHKVPPHMDVRPKWLSLCKIPEDKKSLKILYVCSRHFLRADFCNFKGKKYMLKHGVLPSVFPWDKSKLEAIKAVAKKEKSSEIKEEPGTSVKLEPELTNLVIKEEKQDHMKQERETIAHKNVEESIEMKLEQEFEEEPEKESSQLVSSPTLNFAINSNVEALDFNNEWYPARIIETDYEENEVLIHFINFPNKSDEWISMNSSRLRPAKNTDPISAVSPVMSSGSVISKTPLLDIAPLVSPDTTLGLTTNTDIIISPNISTASATVDIVDGQMDVKKYTEEQTYVIGERCLATWSACRKFPATVVKVLGNNTYEVLFDDGFVKVLKANRITKAGRHLQSSPLFEPITTTKQDRREKKRKLNVAALFKKRPRLDNIEEKQKKSNNPQANINANEPPPEEVQELFLPELPERELSADEIENWKPSWYKGKPVGIETTLQIQDGAKPSYIVPDPRLPEGWVKHILKLKRKGFPAKWDTIIVSPENKKFRSKPEILKYLEEHPTDGLHEKLFDFSLVSKRKRKTPLPVAPVKSPEREPLPTPVPEEPVQPPEEPVIEESNANCLKILFEDDAYKCPIEGCGKIFRRENLAQMHVKHYHPEYTKFLDSTPNVADLAYARTVGENLDRSPGPQKPPLKPAVKTLIPKPTKQATFGIEEIPEVKSIVKPKIPPVTKSKDQEIIKLLNTKPYNKQDPEPLPQQPPVTPSSPHLEITQKDLLIKNEVIPNREEPILKHVVKSKPTGIKTLLPVHRPPPETTVVADQPSEEQYKPPPKRKSSFPDSIEVVKGIDQTKDLKSSTSILPVAASSPTINVSPPVLSLPPKISSQKTSTPLPPPVLTPPLPLPAPTNNVIIEGGEVIKIVRMKQEEIINCTCGFVEEDGLMIQCELCLCWQHAYCNNIERESQVPEKYVCYICQNPLRERPSRKYYHDQDWLMKGTLPVGNYHAKDEDALHKRFDKLKKCHDLSGALIELGQYHHSLKIKMKIAETKNHPKHYLWSKPWPKNNLPEKCKPEIHDIKPKLESDVQEFLKNDFEEEKDTQNENSMLMMILKAGKSVMPKIDLNTLMDNSPIIPRPEAVIDSADCRLNLLEHLVHQCSQVEERLDDFEKHIAMLEEGMNIEEDLDYPKTRSTMQMLMRDLESLKEFSQSSSI